jgi:hypothetical protein
MGDDGSMKSLYDPSQVEDVKQRLALLGTDSTRQWGTMNPAQALTHCAIAMEWAVGDRVPPRLLIGRIIGRLVKAKVLGDDAPMRRHSPTSKDLVVNGRRDLPAERERLRGLIDRFAAAGPEGCTTHPHAFFGRLTPDQWAVLMYKHLDHHLRQFGV